MADGSGPFDYQLTVTRAGSADLVTLVDKANTRAGVDLLTSTWISPEGQIDRYRQLGYLPTLRSVFDEPELMSMEDEYCGGQRLFDVYREVIDDVPDYFQSPDQSIVNDVLSGYLVAAYRGALSPAEALRQAAEDFREQAGRQERHVVTSSSVAGATKIRHVEAGSRTPKRAVRAPYLFIAPFYVLFVLFMVVPIGAALYLSLTEWVGLGSPTWVGLRNYTNLITNSSFQLAIGNTGIYVLISLLIIVFGVGQRGDIFAARIDGCSEFRIFWQVVLPLLRPSLGALAVWTFLHSYNSFLWPLVLISDTDQATLPLGLQTLFMAENKSYDLVLAGSVLATVPTIVVFLLLRRQLLEGLAACAAKGGPTPPREPTRPVRPSGGTHHVRPASARAVRRRLLPRIPALRPTEDRS
jgi:ABC-type spermidine/putrescine transport system permease subunit II